MNFIKRLQLDNQRKDAALTAVNSKLNELRKHLLSEKFHVDTTIQVGDVQRWVTEINNALIDELTRY